MVKFPAKLVDAIAIIVFAFWITQAFTADGLTQHAAGPTSVQPGDDFYDYANAEWLQSNDIPQGHESWSMRDVATAQTAQRIQDLIEAIPTDTSAPAEQRKIADFYHAFMDEARIEQTGIKPLEPILNAIAAIPDKTALASALGHAVRTHIEWTGTNNFDAENLFGLWIAQDFDQPQRNVAYLLQGGLSMPDRSYYDSTDEHMAALRITYQQHITTVFKLIGFNDAQSRAERVFKLETLIAATHTSRADSDDEWKAHNIWNKSDFNSTAPGLDWPTFFRSAGLAEQKTITVWHPSAIIGCAKLVNDVDLTTWKDFLALHLVDQMSATLPSAFRDAHFAFFEQALTGTTTMPARSKMALDALTDVMPDAVGRLYVSHYFSPADKARIEDMVLHIKAAFSQHIDQLTWMSADTKREAQAKLASLYVGIAYPDQWASIDGLKVTADDAFGNTRRAERFLTSSELAKLVKPVNHQEWALPAHVMLALNLGMQNQLNFSAAFLQPPYYDSKASDAKNYGSIGVIIGHEINHMFDELGTRFDSEGRLRYWWTPAEIAHYSEVVAPLVQQYDAYAPLPGVNISGAQTYQENTADLVGLEVAFAAYRSITPPNASIAETDRQFFLGYAQRSPMKLSDAALRKQIASDTHPPSKFRSFSVRNMDAWYSAFNVQPGQALYLSPDQRIHFR